MILLIFEAALYTAINSDIEAALQIIKKRNSTFYQHDDEIELDIDSVDAESFWELERFVTNYKKNLSKQKRKAELALQARGIARTAPVMNSAPMVAGALNSNTGNCRPGNLFEKVPNL
uniref:Bromodomain-containing protein n=1 Tax=Solanum tuberosum TaxID=4113 RepID=M1C8C4_SOLTU